MDYLKPPLSIEQQIRKLIQRGLQIDDVRQASDYLATIGFYRLSAYFIPFEDTRNTQVEHAFATDTNFDDILRLYIFDRKLRLLVLEALERVEVAVRTLWANALAEATSDPHAYMEASHFKAPLEHLNQLNKTANDLGKSSERFVQHYQKKYRAPFLPPIWAMAETLSFGALSRWYANTKDNQVKKKVSDALGIPNVQLMDGILDSLTQVRNTAAHHSRLWNREFIKRQPYLKKLANALVTHQSRDKNNQPQTQMDNHLYNNLVVLCHILHRITPASHWPERLTELVTTLDTPHQKAMGFPEGWTKFPFWRQRIKLSR